MKFVNTLTVNGETFTIQDPNAVKVEDLDDIRSGVVNDVIAALPKYNGEVEEV